MPYDTDVNRCVAFPARMLRIGTIESLFEIEAASIYRAQTDDVDIGSRQLDPLGPAQLVGVLSFRDPIDVISFWLDCVVRLGMRSPRYSHVYSGDSLSTIVARVSGQAVRSARMPS